MKNVEKRRRCLEIVDFTEGKESPCRVLMNGYKLKDTNFGIKLYKLNRNYSLKNLIDAEVVVLLQQCLVFFKSKLFTVQIKTFNEAISVEVGAQNHSNVAANDENANIKDEEDLIV